MTYRPFGAFRTLLALLVVAQHVGPLGPAGMDWTVWATGSTAVLAFFALSGFVITEAAERFYQGRPGAFAVNRGIRIVPQYLLAMVLAIAAVALVARYRPGFFPNELVKGSPAQMFAPGNLATNLIAILPGTKDGHMFVPYAWALRAEIAFYALLAGTIWLASRMRSAAYPILACGGVAIFAAFLAGKGPGLFQFAPFFAYGVIAYFATARRSVGLYAIAAGLFGVCLWTALTISIPSAFAWRAYSAAESVAHAVLFTVLLLTPLVLSRVELPDHWRRVDRRIGDLSYPIYLQQIAVLVVFSAFLPHAYWAVVAAFVAALAMGWLSDRVLERALRKLRDQVRGRRLETPAVAARGAAAGDGAAHTISASPTLRTPVISESR